MSDSGKSRSSNIARWGAACATCANSKSKCLRSDTRPGAKCDRCERLDKECVDQVHKPRKKRESRPSKTAQLEERLNSLVDLLKATNSGELPAGFKNPPSLSEDPLCIPSETEPVSALSTTGGEPTPNSNQDPVGVVPATYNCHAPPSCICRALIGEAPVPVEPDEVLLSVFVTKLSPTYPFVVLRPGISAQELENTRPLLFSAIKMVASVRNVRSMMAQSYVVMKQITERLLMRAERSLELLQTILLTLGFYHYHCMMHTQMNNLVSLAVSLAADLGLNKSPGLQERTRVLVLNPEMPKPRTNDERRALCGMWYISALVAHTFQKTDAVRYTPYINQCVSELESAKEYETDAFLVQLVRIQHLSDRIVDLHTKDSLEEELPGIPRAPASAYLNAFQAELDKFKAHIPRHLRTHKQLLNHYNSAVLRLWEPPIVNAKLLESLSDSFTSMSLGGPSTLDIFFRSNAALKSWFEFWLSIEVSDYFYLPMSACAQLIVAVTLLSRWAKLAGVDPISPTATNPGSLNSRASSQNIADPYPNTTAETVSDTKLPETEPAVVSAIVAIKAQIRSQPALQLDVMGILRALVTRFERVRSEVSEVQGGVWDNIIWDLAAKKISITRLKLERWAEIVSTVGPEGLLTRKYEPSEGPVPDSAHPDIQLPRSGPMDGVERSETYEFQSPQQGQDMSSYFAHDLFSGLGLDQNFFYDEAGDYGTVVLENLAFNSHMNGPGP